MFAPNLNILVSVNVSCMVQERQNHSNFERFSEGSIHLHFATERTTDGMLNLRNIQAQYSLAALLMLLHVNSAHIWGSSAYPLVRYTLQCSICWHTVDLLI